MYIYNERIIQGGIKPNLAIQFASIAAQIDDKVPHNLWSSSSVAPSLRFVWIYLYLYLSLQNIADIWRMVQCMIDVSVRVEEDVLSARVSPTMQAGFVTQARKYLEET